MERLRYILIFYLGLAASITFGQDRVVPDSQQEAAAFGYHLALDGNWLLVGAKDDTLNNVAGGAAYFYKRENDDWLFWQKVGAEVPTAGDLFGISVDIDGEYAVIGADGDDELSLNSGAAYLYKLIDDHWQFSQKLLPMETGLGSSEMGIAVAMKDNLLVVGAYSDMTNGQFSGAAYIYELSGGSWLLKAKVMPMDGVADDKFGRSVHTDGRRVIICGVLNDDNGTNSGSAYVYTKSGENWLETAKLLAPDAAENDRFGRSVAINGTYAAIGSVLDDDNGEQSGSVYIFREDANGWHFDYKITPDDGKADDFFGYALSFNNPYLLVGAHNVDDHGLNSGAAYLFKRFGASWLQQQKIYASNPQAGVNFGEAVDLNDNYLAIGAPYELNKGMATGAGYIFESPLLTELTEGKRLIANVYPNPAANIIHVEIPEGYHVRTATIIDQAGRVLDQWEDHRMTMSVNLQDYPVGVYNLLLNFSSGEQEILKIIKP